MISEVDRNAVNMSLAAIPHARDCGRVVHPTNSEQSIGYTERRFTFVADAPRHFRCDTCGAKGPELPVHLSGEQVMEAMRGMAMTAGQSS
jgi:hypothetical protein